MGAPENADHLLVHGDNLEALAALLPFYVSVRSWRSRGRLPTAAIKTQGFRPTGLGHRQTLFSLASQLLPGAAAARAVLADAHHKRNRHEYDGAPIHVTGAMLDAVIDAVAGRGDRLEGRR